MFDAEFEIEDETDLEEDMEEKKINKLRKLSKKAKKKQRAHSGASDQSDAKDETDDIPKPILKLSPIETSNVRFNNLITKYIIIITKDIN